MTEEDEAFEELAKRQGDWGLQGSRKHQIMRYLENNAMREVQRLGQEIEQKIGCVNHDCEQCKAQRTEQNFCPRCGKRTKDIHTCTPPKENT